MKSFRIFVDMDKEEQYLNNMAKSGFIMKNYSLLGIYTFIKAEPKDSQYRIDYRVFKNKVEFGQYKTLFEDAGWEHVSGTSYSGAQYFLPKLSNMEFPDIFSDAESKSTRYKRFIKQCISGFACALIYMFIMFSEYGFKFNNFGYLTPGLWDKKGLNFWFAFAFETPFAILRILPLIVFMIYAILSLDFSFKARKLYKESLRDTSNSRL
ncbi:MAG: DUF2812 domain-containing protein [Clostridiaceae bacterium]|nr:DUF2812 domain-containing protein [Clostridiaceae bacterium]